MRARGALVSAVALALLAAALAHRGQAATLGSLRSGTVIASAAPVRRRLRAYGQIRPVALTLARAMQAGIVSRLALPGERIRMNQVLAVIAGPQAQALLARRRGALRAARVRLDADRRQLAAQLVTRQQLAADQAAYLSARGALRAALRTLTVRSPVAGRVLSVAVGDGTQVTAGEPLLTLQAGRLWLAARFYGAAARAVHPGMLGRFRPVAGATSVAVRVVTVAGALAADGGTRVLLQPKGMTGAAARLWRSGQWGTVTLPLATRTLVAVPTRALILDRAHWWVVLRTAHGDRPQRVVPGPARGWLTYLESGVQAGEPVVVENADLAFHHDIASHYTPPN